MTDRVKISENSRIFKELGEYLDLCVLNKKGAHLTSIHEAGRAVAGVCIIRTPRVCTCVGAISKQGV